MEMEALHGSLMARRESDSVASFDTPWHAGRRSVAKGTERGLTHVRNAPRDRPGEGRPDSLDSRPGGERNAAKRRDRLRGSAFSRTLVSSLGRARQTCAPAGCAVVKRPGRHRFRDR